MFSGLTTLFFGSKQETNQLDNINICNKRTRKLKTKEDDDGWIVVSDKKKKAERTEHIDLSDESDEELDANMSISFDSYVGTTTVVASEFNPSPPPPASPPTPSSLTQLDPDGSWYLTPPSCFTAGSSSTNTTFVSPMENLLIEHPSMSVYQREDPAEAAAIDGLLATTPITPPVAVLVKASSTREDPPIKASEIAKRRGRQRRLPSPSIATSAGLIFAQILSKEAENKRIHLRQEANKRNKYFRQNQLDRSNKVMEFNGVGKKMRRKEKMKNSSGMNNNRKC